MGEAIGALIGMVTVLTVWSALLVVAIRKDKDIFSARWMITFVVVSMFTLGLVATASEVLT
jgi:general stress protein CsbA